MANAVIIQLYLKIVCIMIKQKNNENITYALLKFRLLKIKYK